MHLLDTHTVLWALSDDPRLGATARSLWLDASAPLVLSAASVWEMAIKVSIGRLRLARPLTALLQDLDDQGIPVLPIEARHAVAVQHLPWHHRDPFDRLLVATARVDTLPLVTADATLSAYEIPTVW